MISFDALARHGSIDAKDVELVYRPDSVGDASEWLMRHLREEALGNPGAVH